MSDDRRERTSGPTPRTTPVIRPGNGERTTRRRFLAGAAAAVATAATPRILRAKPTKTRLRVLGTHVTLQEPIRQRAMEELGIEIEFEPGGSAYVLQKAATRPESFDVYEQWSDSIRILWQANAIQPIEAERIDRLDEINALTREGRLVPSARLGAGDAPYRIRNVQADGTLGAAPSARLSFLPYVHNVDSFGYDTRRIRQGEAYRTESWGWLLDPAQHGRVGLVNSPTIGLFDMALAAQARGLIEFDDLGNMTRDEIDRLMDLMIDYKERGHFGGIWNSVPESIELVRSGRVAIASMFSPAVSSLNAGGVPVTYAAPREGYRAWHGVMCLSANARGEVRDAAYRFMNWWISGWPGAFIARQGYYISNPERSRGFLSSAEWDYWYGGEAAREDLPGPDGRIVVRVGSRRTGGSYERRFSNVAVWNTVMDSYEYSLTRWADFLRS